MYADYLSVQNLSLPVIGVFTLFFVTHVNILTNHKKIKFTPYFITYRLHFATKFNIKSSFVDITNIELVEKSIKKSTKILYCESVSNPLLEVANIKKL